MTLRLERAQALLELGRPAEAVPLLRDHLAEHPQDADALSLLARAHLIERDPQRALEAANAAVASAPDEEWGHRLASVALLSLGLRDEAVRAAETAVRLAPHAWQTHVRMAEALCAVGRSTDGSYAADRAVELAPDVPGTHRAVGDAALAGGDLDGAERAYRRALAIEPDSAALLNDLGLVEMRRKRWTRAADSFTGAARLAPADPVGARNLVVVGWRLLRRAGWATAASFLLLLAVPEEGAGLGHRAAVAVPVLVLAALVLGRTLRRLPVLSRQVLARRVLRTPLGAACCALLLVGAGGWVAVLADARAVSAVDPVVLWSGVGAGLLAALGAQRHVAEETATGERAFSWRRRPRV